MAAKEGSNFFQKLYYVSFSTLALAGVGYLGYKIYKEHQEAQKGEQNERKSKDKKKEDDFEAEVQRRLKERKEKQREPEEESSVYERSVSRHSPERERGRTFKNGLIKEYMTGKEGGGFSVGKGKGSAKVRLMQLLTEIKKLCGSDVTLIKTESRKRRRSTMDDADYLAIIKETQDRMESMIDKNIAFVCTKYEVTREEFDTLLDENQDDDVVGILNSLCASEM